MPLLAHHHLAWDAATGNGQVAGMLANYFDQVIATDISENQLKHAIRRPNIQYRLEPAEKSSIADASLDLVTVAQAIHWFRFEAFYAEVKRTLKPKGLIAVIGYPLLTIDPVTDAIIQQFYAETLHHCWDPERKYLDEWYASIPFPFHEVETPAFSMKYDWSLHDLAGFLSTWSAVQQYIIKHHINPVDEIMKKLAVSWGEKDQKSVYFPVILRIGRLQ